MTYSELAYDRAVVRARDLLAELRWIDDAMAFLDRPHAVDDPTIGEQASTGIRFLTARLGHTYPFTATGDAPVPAYLQRDADDLLPRLESRARTWAAGVVDALAPPLRHLKNSVSPRLADLAWHLHDETFVTLDTDVAEHDIGKLGVTLAHWRGDAASTFSREFYSPFAEVNSQQRLVVLRLAAAIGVQKGILDVAQQGMMNLVDGVVEMLDQQLRNRQAQEAAETQQQIEIAASGLSIIGTVAGLAPGAAAGTAAVSVLSTLLSFAGSQIPSGDTRTLNIVVADAAQVATAWGHGIGDVVEANRDHQQEFASRDVKSLVEDAETAVRSGNLFPPRPQLGGVTPGTFHHDSAP